MSDRRPSNRELTAQLIRDTVRRVFRQGYSEDEDILLLWQAAEAHAECLDDPVAVVRRGPEKTLRVVLPGYEDWIQPPTEEASPADLLAVVRRGVESGTIKGEVVEASYDDDWLASGYSLPVSKSGVYVVIGPVSLSEQKTEDQ